MCSSFCLALVPGIGQALGLGISQALFPGIDHALGPMFALTLDPGFGQATGPDFPAARGVAKGFGLGLAPGPDGSSGLAPGSRLAGLWPYLGCGHGARHRPGPGQGRVVQA